MTDLHNAQDGFDLIELKLQYTKAQEKIYVLEETLQKIIDIGSSKYRSSHAMWLTNLLDFIFKSKEILGDEH